MLMYLRAFRADGTKISTLKLKSVLALKLLFAVDRTVAAVIQSPGMYKNNR